MSSKKSGAVKEKAPRKSRAKKGDPAASSDMPAGPNTPLASTNGKAKNGAKPKAEKKVKTPKPEKDPTKMSALDAAAKVLDEAGKPMRCKEMVEAMEAKGYWKSPGGKTPAATLSAEIIVEIRKKGGDARFKKADRGLFAAA
jgi:hypothetical protein